MTERVEETNYEHMMDVENISISVKAELEMVHPLSDECCIYRVPKRLLELNERAYTPRLVSIGPFHNGKEELKAMEEHKKRYLKEFLQHSQVSVEEYVKVIKEKEARLLNCYAEPILLSSEGFVKMVLLDAAFIIMLLLKRGFDFLQKREDRIFNKSYLMLDLRTDIFLLENQLPFFILDDLYKLSNLADQRGMEISLIKLIHVFAVRIWSKELVVDNILKMSSPTGLEHLVDFLRVCLQPSELRPNRIKNLPLSTPTILQLQRAGVKLKLSSSTHLLDIKFDKIQGVLEIPRLKVDDGTEILFRNVQAYEQCHLINDNRNINDYVAMINSLVKAPEDVEILVKNGIIENWLRVDAVSTLFYSLSKQTGVSPDDFLFSGIIEELNAYCRAPWHKWKAILKQDYFSTPWAALSVSAAGILLILTLIQTVCSIIQTI